MHVTFNAPAKVNLYLEINGKRNDGYHNLVSIMQMVSLFDTISIGSLKKRMGCRIEGSFPFKQRENTIWRAVDLFRQRTGLKQGINISVEKRIPLGAGLGGGASDAALVLYYLNLLFDTPLNQRDLRELGLEVGSDVPFFFGSTAALITGRGENVTPLRPRTDFQIVLVHPGFPISTYQAYTWFDKMKEQETERDKGPLSSVDALKTLMMTYENAAIKSWKFKNSFDSVIYGAFPVLNEIRTSLTDMGALHAGISGSGSTVIGIFALDSKAERAARRLQKNYPCVAVLEPLETKPKPVLK
jgi:4-diphosphocytidyl-2-C-methyl-D-erythritol kinase